MQSYTIDGIIIMPPIEADYRLDPTIVTEGNTIAYEQGYTYTYHNFLEDARDFSFNKSSNFYLTQNTNIFEFFNIIDIPYEYPRIASTFLAFNRINTDPLSALTANDSTCLTSFSGATGSELTATSATTALSAEGQDLVTDYITILPDIDIDEESFIRLPTVEKFIDLKTKETLEQRYYFNIMYIDAVNCFIYHLDGDDRWYLSHKDEVGETLKFVKITHEQSLENNIDQIEVDGGDKIKFQYTLSRDGLLRIYKKYQGSTHVLKILTEEERELSPNILPVRLEDMLSPDNNSNPEDGGPNILELTPDTTIRMRPAYKTKLPNEMLQPHDYNYVIGKDKNNIEVDANRSSDIQVNMLVHSEYYYLTGESIPINFFNLKNNITPDGISSNNNLYPGQPNNIFRDYNKINTGSNQLGGSSNIEIGYNTEVAEYVFKPGMNYFNTPLDISPYERININDTNIISSGAIAGLTPADSDKIFKKNAGYGEYTRWGETQDEQLGTWLCTWLSGSGDPNDTPIWVDRYYNASNVGYVDALSANMQSQHSVYDSDQLDVYETDEQIVDRPSKLTFEPGRLYAYYRLSNKDINIILSELKPGNVQKGFDSYTTTGGQPVDDPKSDIVLKSNRVAKTGNLKLLDDFDNVSINFDINIDQKESAIGHQLIGNYTNTGFGLFNTNDISPFLFILGSDGDPVDGVFQNSSVRIYDNNFKLYNYITNDSFLLDDDEPSLFKNLFIRELPENIYALLENGQLIEMNHDGVILWKYNTFNVINSTDIIVDTCHDDRYIYILTHSEAGDTHDIFQFDMLSKNLMLYNKECLVEIPIPDELKPNINNDYNYGRAIEENAQPNKIFIKNDVPPYQDHRSIYIGHGDDIKSGKRYIWLKVTGDISPVSKLQVKHDVLYAFDTKTLKLVPGVMTDNKLADSTLPLNILDYTLDRDDNIWVCHQENIISQYNSDRRLLSSRQIADREVLSLVVTRDLIDGEIVEYVLVLNKSIGEELIQTQIGPVNHPTNNPNHQDWRKASPWTEDGLYYSRNRFINVDDVVYDDLSSFDDASEVIYPFMDGNIRFGEQIGERFLIDSDDTSGRVLDGDYIYITEGFDELVTETANNMYINRYDAKTTKLINIDEVGNFNIDSIEVRPQMLNHYEYTMQNYMNYAEHNLNLKILLEPKFKKAKPEMVNMLIDLQSLSSKPYTGYHNFNIKIDNNTGCVELRIDGNIHDLSHIYKFEKNKFRFNNIFYRTILAGASPYINDTLLCDKLGDHSRYTVKNVTIKNFNVYNCDVNRTKILNIMRSRSPVEPMKWELPCGSRSYVDSIDKVFNHSIPPRKSNIFNVVLRNSSIRSTSLQRYISNKIESVLPTIIPGDTRVKEISWSNELLEFTEPEDPRLLYDAPLPDEIIVDPSGITLPAYLPYVLQ